MKKSAQPPHAQVATEAGGERIVVGSSPEKHSPNKYGQLEIEQLISHRIYVQQQQQQTAGGNVVVPEHFEKQRAEAAVHQHFAESFKLVQQQRVSGLYFLHFITARDRIA